MQRGLFILLLCFTPIYWAGAVPAADGLANIAGPQYGTRVVADTQFSAEYGGEKAADGSLERGAGCWYSKDQTQLPCALTFTLSQAEAIREVVLHQAQWSGNMYHTRGFSIEVAEDGAQWRRVGTGELPDQDLARVSVPLDGVKTRLLRLVVLTSYNDFQTCGLAEVELLAAGLPDFSPASYELDGEAGLVAGPHCGLSLLAPSAAPGPQVAVTSRPAGFLAAVAPGETVGVVVDVKDPGEGCVLSATAALSGDRPAGVAVRVEGGPEVTRTLRDHARLRLDIPPGGAQRVRLVTAGLEGETAVRWSEVRLSTGGREFAIPLSPTPTDYGSGAPPVLPAPRGAIERALIEWDWRLQDGIDTPRNPSSYAEAADRLLQRGDALLADLAAAGVALPAQAARWERLSREFRWRCDRGRMVGAGAEDLWLRLHALKREIALANPLADLGPIAFVKQVPGAFSHQLTQYYGRYAKPGGGVFVLQEPGRSMAARALTDGRLPTGSYQHLDVSHEGDRILFAFCEAETAPKDTRYGHKGRTYSLYEVLADGSRLRRITEGPYEDFSPRYTPDGRLLFISTRRRGWHRCGSPGCENYVLTTADLDGSNCRPISRHETQEWDPGFLPDGRIIYTRWDYVDRNAVFFEQLWTTAPDGTRPAIFFGNNTFNPVGIWEPVAVPGSRRVMATAAAHHAMTAGSIILVDVGLGVDGEEPITRLTPDVPFPEGETKVQPYWFSAVGKLSSTPENDRWPGHCYRSPYPLSETYFLAAYSFDGLIGEPTCNVPNMFGLYLVDAHGNRELLYRDIAISSLWPMPLRPRERPQPLPSVCDQDRPDEGHFILQDVYRSSPGLAPGSIKALRILQVLPKSTPDIDNPAVGRAHGAPGKQVLGTVPVETDGSAYFRAPANTPLAFQALDEQGMAIQIMRSLTYLQPGETTSCVGCHEERTTAPPVKMPAAARRAASQIQSGPEGSKPFSYPLLVQPVLDRHCVRCHSGDRPAGNVALTGAPEGHYTVSYNALAPRVPISDQNSLDSLSQPDRYGARGSAVTKMLLQGHGQVKLSAGEWERLVTWMDANALFYGTFDPEDQARQQRGEQIAGPALE